uniref:Mitochondrial glutamate carrier 1 n=1 Tax=Cacopsylla melanoneura TaxID=428564 RepID=A0A8D9FBE9_9HEMI
MSDLNEFSILSKTINGGLSSIIGITLLYPLDLVKTRLQIQHLDPSAPKISFISFFRKTLKAEGFFGMYRGSSVSYVLVTPEKALYLASNDFFRHHLSDGSPEELSVRKSVVAGALAAICTLTLQTPMELIKIKMQDSSFEKKANALSICVDIYKSKGVQGFYQGTVATGCRDLTFSCILFPLFAYIKHRGPKTQSGSQETKNYWSFLSGSVAGSAAAFTSTPFDVIKTRLQVNRGLYAGVWDAGQKIYRTEGVRALFKGGLCRVMIMAPMFGILQMIYQMNISESLLGGIRKRQD